MIFVTNSHHSQTRFPKEEAFTYNMQRNVLDEIRSIDFYCIHCYMSIRSISYFLLIIIVIITIISTASTTTVPPSWFISPFYARDITEYRSTLVPYFRLIYTCRFIVVLRMAELFTLTHLFFFAGPDRVRSRVLLSFVFESKGKVQSLKTPGRFMVYIFLTFSTMLCFNIFLF